MSFTWWRYPTRRFAVDGVDYAVTVKAQGDALASQLTANGTVVASDQTPILGPGSTRNHQLSADPLTVEAGYIGMWTTGIVVRRDGRTVFESHRGRAPQYPQSLRATTESGFGGTKLSGLPGGDATSAMTTGAFARRNRIPLIVDIATGILFYIVAKATDLTTAALVGAAVGIALVVFQRLTRIDVTGGLALFGIVMLCLSATIAWLAKDEAWVQLRGTITGLVAAGAFLGDALVFKGQRLAAALTRYLPYGDIDLPRLGIGLAASAATMALLNVAVVQLASKDVWLFYTTFADTVISIALFFQVLRYARHPGQAAPA